VVHLSSPIGISVAADVEFLPSRPQPYRARVRWTDPVTGRRRSKSQSTSSLEDAQAWIEKLRRAGRGGIDPIAATMTLAQYGDAAMALALRGLEAKTLHPTSRGGTSVSCRASGTYQSG
jgi:hypothetical protein